jgi:glycosyltransferase involved in cell wall biosynthesis
MSKPLISVLIPMYNAERGIVDTLESIKQQTFQDFEVIIVNDGSTDRSVEYARAILPQAVILAQENLGIATALNLGL